MWAVLCIGSLLISSKNASNIRSAARKHLPGIKGKGAGPAGEISNTTGEADIRICLWVIPANTTWMEKSPADSCDDCGRYLSKVFAFASVGLVSWCCLLLFLWVGRHPGLLDHVYHRRERQFKRREAKSCWWQWLHCLPVRKRFLFCHETVQSTERAGALAILPFLFFAIMLIPYDPFQSRILLEATNLFCAVLLGMVALGVLRAMTAGSPSDSSGDEEEEEDTDNKGAADMSDEEEEEAVMGAASILAGSTVNGERHVGDDNSVDGMRARDGDDETGRFYDRPVDRENAPVGMPPPGTAGPDASVVPASVYVHEWKPLQPASGQSLYSRVVRYVTTHDVLENVFRHRNILHVAINTFFVGLLCLQTLVICPNEKRPVVAQTGSISGFLSLLCAVVASIVSILFITDLIFSVPASDFVEAKVWVAEIRRMLDEQLSPIIRAARRAGSDIARNSQSLMMRRGRARRASHADSCPAPSPTVHVNLAGIVTEEGDNEDDDAEQEVEEGMRRGRGRGGLEVWEGEAALTPLLAEWWRTMDGIGERRVKFLLRAGRRRLVWVLLGSIGLLIATLLRYLGRYGAKGGLLLALLDGVTALMVTLTFGSFAASVLVMKETLRVGKLADGIVGRIRSARLFLEVMLESLRLNKGAVRGNVIEQLETVVRQLDKFEGALSKGSSLAPTICGFRVRQELVVGYVITLMTGVLVPLIQSIILSQ